MTVFAPMPIASDRLQRSEPRAEEKSEQFLGCLRIRQPQVHASTIFAPIQATFDQGRVKTGCSRALLITAETRLGTEFSGRLWECDIRETNQPARPHEDQRRLFHWR